MGSRPLTALKLLAEIGTDMTRWPTEKHFTSWLTLAPNNKITGGRVISSRTQPSANRAAATLRMAAMSLGRTQTALGAFYRRLAARLDKPQAITATARKLAILVYRALKGGTRLSGSGRRPLRRDHSARACCAGSVNAPRPSASNSSTATTGEVLVGRSFLGGGRQTVRLKPDTTRL